MKKILLFTSIGLLTFSTAYISAQTKTEFKTDPKKSKVNWVGKKPTGQHNGTVNISNGILVVEKDEIISGNFTIDLNTILVVDLEPGTLNNKLVGHLKSEDFFNVEKFPIVKFKLSKAVKKDNANYILTGDLTMKGITHPVTFGATVNINKGSLTAKSSEIILDRVKWDVKTMSKSVFADLKDNYIDDEMIITVELNAVAK